MVSPRSSADLKVDTIVQLFITGDSVPIARVDWIQLGWSQREGIDIGFNAK
jgi:hypothetical protein